MTEKQPTHIGFFLGFVPAEDGTKLLHVAAMSTSTGNRTVAKLRSINKKPFNAAIGELILLLATVEDLEDHLPCSFSNTPQPLFIHDGDLVHTHVNFEVGEKDCTSSGVYRHLELNEMIDPKNLMVPGAYHTMTFRVIPEKDTFTIEILQAVRKTGDLIDPAETDKFELIGLVLAAEKDHITLQENESWRTLGNLKLERWQIVSHVDIRPVFELINKEFTDIFQQRIKGGPQIVMIKQVQIDGEWEDDPNWEEMKGCAFETDSRQDMCVIKLASRICHQAQIHMKLEEIYRFETFLSSDDINFWRQNKHNDHHVFQHTVAKDEPGLKPTESSLETPTATWKDTSGFKLMDALESHMMNGEELNSLKDKKINMSVLNETQRKAVQMARNKDRKLVCIQGPPGTGKTFVLANYISVLLHDNTPAVVMTPTKEALFNIKRITKSVLKAQGRKFHPDTFMDFWEHEDRIEAMKLPQEEQEQEKRLRKLMEEGKMSPEEYAQLTRRLYNKIKQEVEKEMFENVKIVFSTITSSFVSSIVKKKYFDPEVCIIDEAGQVMEAQTWPACLMKRIVMAGDPRQLPAIVFSEEAKNFQLENSVMDRIMKQKERFSWIMLEDQYRCHPEIIAWSSKVFYEGKVNTVGRIDTLRDLFNRAPKTKISRVYDPMVLIDTSMEIGTDLQTKCFEKAVFTTTSANKKKGDFTYANEGEAEIAIEHFKNLVKYGIKQESIAIITPYKGQLELMREMVQKQNLGTVHIGTVDSYQGQEFDVVIFSMVRSNPALKLGFVEDLRRLNVAVTRARNHFCFIGNAFLLMRKGTQERSPGPEIKRLLETFKDSNHRFPPCFVREEFKSFDKNARISNNFGLNFQLFLNVTNDKWMEQYVVKFLENAAQYSANRRANNRSIWNRNNEASEGSENALP